MCAHARLITFFFSFGSPRERRMTAGSKWVLMDELKRFQMPKACVSNLLVQELMTRVSSLTGHFSHLLTHLFFFNLCVKREKNVDRLVENAKRQDRKPLQRRSLSQRFLFSCVRWCAWSHYEPLARDQTQEKDESDRLQTGIVMPSLSSENGSRI